jgi:hypothetical protein
MPSDPTPAEIMLRLEHITQQLTQVVGSVERLSSRMEQSYVRKDVYGAEHHALRADVFAKATEIERDIDEIKADRKDDAKYRRQTWTAIGMAFLVALIGILTSIMQTGGSL